MIEFHSTGMGGLSMTPEIIDGAYKTGKGEKSHLLTVIFFRHADNTEETLEVEHSELEKMIEKRYELGWRVKSISRQMP